MAQPPCSLAITAVIDDDDCDPGKDDGAIGLLINGGKGPFNFLWNNGSTTQNIYGLTLGNYAVTVADEYGCTGTKTFQVSDQQCCQEFSDFPFVDVIAHLNPLVQPLFVVPIGVNYSLNRDLIIPAGIIVVFNNNTLKINRRVQILLKPEAGLKIINNSHFSACNKMWKGIYTEYGVQSGLFPIVIQNSTIMDAEKALFAVKDYEIDAIQATFDNNIVGIETAWYPNNGDLICDKLTVRESNFIHSSPLKSPYVGQAAYGTKPLAGMIVRSFKGGNTGRCNYEIGNNQSSFNTFENLNTGIQFINCQNPQVRNAKFINISSENFYPQKYMGSAVYCITYNNNYPTDSLIVRPLTNQNLNNATITDCQYGIYTDKVGALLNNLTMVNVVKGIVARQSNSINGFTFTNNIIHASKAGIELYHNATAPGIKIDHNTIHTTDPVVGTGISATLLNAGISNHLYIAQNEIFCDGSTHGINLLKVDNAKIWLNKIYSSNASSLKFIGINLNGSSSNQITDNLIYGSGVTAPNAANGTGTHGMRFSISANNTIKCNFVDNTSYGIGFYGQCPSIDFAGNEMKHHFEGLHLSGTAVIGPTVRRGNTWLDPSVYIYGGFGAVNLNYIGGVITLKKSEFKIDPSSPTSTLTYSPTMPFNNAGWFTLDPGPSFSCCPTCTAISNLGEITQLDLAIAHGDTITSEWPEESISMAEMYLYKKLYDHPELLNVDPILQTFYDTHANLAAGLLNNVANKINAIDAYTAFYEGLINKTDSIIATVTDSINIIDSIRVSIDNDSIYAFERNNLINTLSNLDTDKVNMNLQKNAFTNNSIIEAYAENALVIPVELPEINECAVNELYLNSLAPNFIGYSLSQANQLFAIGHQCPYAGGPAVYRARAIYQNIDEAIEYDDVSTCLAQGIFRTTKSKIPATVARFTLVPNPASDKVELRFNMENNIDRILEIFENTGRFVKNVNIPLGQTVYLLNTSDLAGGIYIIILKSSNTVTEQTKLTVIK